MKKLKIHYLSDVFFILLLFIFVFGTFNLDLSALTIKQNEELIIKISKDFSKKFCNGVGFGLSEESAMKFAIKENIETFKNRKGIENIDIKQIADKLSLSVNDRCGYSLNFSEEDMAINYENLS